MNGEDFIKKFPSMKVFGKSEREVFKGEKVVSEGLWSESVIESCCLDKQKVKESINNKLKYIKEWMSKENAIYSPEYTQKQAQFEILQGLKQELGLKK